MSTVPGSPYDALSFRDLQAECKKRGLKAMAKKAELTKSLEEWDKSPAAQTPQKGRPRPNLSTPSTLRATSYPPPTPPYSEHDSDSASEPPSPQPDSPGNTPKRNTTPSHTTPDVPSPFHVRFPVPASPYVATKKETDKIPGWMLQTAFFALILAIALVVTFGGSSENPFREQHTVESLRTALSEYSAGDKIAQALSVRQRLVLIGPIEQGTKVAKKIASLLTPHNSTNPLVLKEANSTLLVEKIAAKLTKNPESVVIINTDVIDRDNSHFLNMLLDDTLPTLVNHNDVRVGHAVLILLADLARDAGETEITHEFVEKSLRERWDDRVAERIYPIVVL